MAEVTDPALNGQFEQIRDETAAGANTKLRVYNALKNLYDTLKASIGLKADATAVTTALAGKIDSTGGIFRAAVGEALNGYVGPYGSSNLFYSTFVVSGNITPNKDGAGAFTGSWTVGKDGLNNGAQMFVYTVNSGLKFINIPSTGNANTVYTDAQLAALATTVEGDRAAKDLSINTQTASYTLALTDRANMVRMNVASANTLTVPPNSAVAFPVGTQIVLAQAGAGQTTVVAGSGVTINASGTKMKLSGQYSGATLVQVSANVWLLMGDLSA